MRDARTIRVTGTVALGALLLIAGVPSGSRAQQQRAGFEAHVDPETGEFVEPPTRVPRSSTTLTEPAPGSPPEAVELREEPSPAGGVSVELRGAFRSTVRATVAPGGEADTRCDGGHAPAARRASE